MTLPLRQDALSFQSLQSAFLSQLMSKHLVGLPVVSALKVFELSIVPRSAVLMATMLAMAGFASGGLVPDTTLPTNLR